MSFLSASALLRFAKFNSAYIEQNMSETGTRRTTREKKPPRQYWYDEPDYNNLVGSKNQEPKEKASGSQQVNALAKMFVKFINSCNMKYKELIDTMPSDPNTNLQDHLLPHDYENNGGQRRPTGRGVKQGPDGQRGGRTHLGDNSNVESRSNPKETKVRGPKQPRGGHSITAALETDLSYHNAINEHVKSTYPNINSISADMLKDISIPTQILSKPPVKAKKEEKKSMIRPGKEENKPFKRQSYHVAIAYHIHLKQVKTTKAVQYVDPTFPARKLKEQEYKRP